MKLTDIPRMQVGALLDSPTNDLKELHSERARLATRAADLLGYRTLAQHVSGRGPALGECVGKLAEALKALDIEVLDAHSVLRYQMDEAARLTLEKAQEDFRSWTNGYFIAAQWGHTDISNYDHPIPEFVLDKAVKIKERLPEVIFHVQHLNEPKADPFLIAVHGKEIYYIEAWDEPRFESTL